MLGATTFTGKFRGYVTVDSREPKLPKRPVQDCHYRFAMLHSFYQRCKSQAALHCMLVSGRIINADTRTAAFELREIRVTRSRGAARGRQQAKTPAPA